MHDGPSTPDRSANTGGHELETTIITFRELTQRLSDQYPRRPQPGIQPTNIHFFGLNFDPETRKGIPNLSSSFDPPLPTGRNGGLGVRSYSISSPQTQDQFVKDMWANPTELNVYDVDVDQILDPAFTGEIEKTYAVDVLVAINQAAADKMGSWIADPNLRRRIQEYADAKLKVFHALKLRDTITNPPGRIFETGYYTPMKGRYISNDYAGIKAQVEEAERGERDIRELGELSYTRQDVEWLEAHMKAKGIPIPTPSSLEALK